MAESDTPKPEDERSSTETNEEDADAGAEAPASENPSVSAKLAPESAPAKEHAPETEKAATVIDDSRDGPSWLPLAIAIALPVLFFFVLPPLTRAGLWDPHELNVADLARRIALNLHGAADLALEGTDNSLPHLNDLGRPQLPFTERELRENVLTLRESPPPVSTAEEHGSGVVDSRCGCACVAA